MARRRFTGRPIVHLITRGVERRWVYESESLKWRLLNLLGEAALHHDVRILAFVLMSNHYHLIATAEGGDLSRLMRRINQRYSTYFNRVNKRVGTLYQGRFRSFLIRSDAWLLSRTAYLHANPPAAGIGPNPEAYLWSSYRAYVGKENPPSWLDVRSVLTIFSPDLDAARERYAAYMRSILQDNCKERSDAEWVDEEETSPRLPVRTGFESGSNGDLIGYGAGSSRVR